MCTEVPRRASRHVRDSRNITAPRRKECIRIVLCAQFAGFLHDADDRKVLQAAVECVLVVEDCLCLNPLAVAEHVAALCTSV